VEETSKRLTLERREQIVHAIVSRHKTVSYSSEKAAIVIWLAQQYFSVRGKKRRLNEPLKRNGRFAVISGAGGMLG
jgi:hypothetical protein